MTNQPPAPLVVIDTMLGFRLTSGLIILNLAFVRTSFDGAQLVNFIQPTLDLAMPIPVLRNIMATLTAELDSAEAKAQLQPHPTQQ